MFPQSLSAVVGVALLGIVSITVTNHHQLLAEAKQFSTRTRRVTTTTTSVLPLQPPENVTSTTTSIFPGKQEVERQTPKDAVEVSQPVHDDDAKVASKTAGKYQVHGSKGQVGALPALSYESKSSKEASKDPEGYLHFELNVDEEAKERERELEAQGKKPKKSRSETVNEVLSNLFPNGFSDIFRFSYPAEPTETKTTTTSTTPAPMTNTTPPPTTTPTPSAASSVRVMRQSRQPGKASEPQTPSKSQSKQEIRGESKAKPQASIVGSDKSTRRPSQRAATRLGAKPQTQTASRMVSPDKSQTKTTTTQRPVWSPAKPISSSPAPTQTSTPPELPASPSQNKTFSFETSISKETRRELSPGHTQIVIEKVHYPRDRSSEFQDGHNTITKELLLRINRAAEDSPVLPSLLLEPRKENATSEEELLLSRNGPIVILKDNSGELDGDGDGDDDDQGVEDDNLIAESQHSSSHHVYQRLPEDLERFPPPLPRKTKAVEHHFNVQIVHDKTQGSAALDQFQEHAEKSFQGGSVAQQLSAEAPSRQFLKHFKPSLSQGAPSSGLPAKGSFHYEQTSGHQNGFYHHHQGLEEQQARSLGGGADYAAQFEYQVEGADLSAAGRVFQAEDPGSSRKPLYVTVSTPSPPSEPALTPQKPGQTPHEYVSEALAASTQLETKRRSPSGRGGYTFVEVQKSINIHNKLITEQDGKLLAQHETIYHQPQYVQEIVAEAPVEGRSEGAHQQQVQEDLGPAKDYVSLTANPIHVQHLDDYEEQPEVAASAAHPSAEPAPAHPEGQPDSQPPSAGGQTGVGLYVEKIVEKPVPYPVEVERVVGQQVPVAVPVPVEVPVDRPYAVTQVVEKHVPEPYPVVEVVEKVVDRPVNVPVPVHVPVAVENAVDREVEVKVPYAVPVDRYIDRPYPVHEVIEKHIPMPYPVPEPVAVPVHYDHYIDRPYPVETIVEKPVHVPYPVETVVEKVVEKHVPVEVERIVEKPVERIVEKYVDRPVAIPIHVPVAFPIALRGHQHQHQHHQHHQPPPHMLHHPHPHPHPDHSLPYPPFLGPPPSAPSLYPHPSPPQHSYPQPHPNALAWASAPSGLGANIPPKVLQNYYTRMIKKLLPQLKTTGAAAAPSTTTTTPRTTAGQSHHPKQKHLKLATASPYKILDIRFDLKPPPPSGASWSQGARYVYKTLPADLTAASATGSASGPAQEDSSYVGQPPQYVGGTDEFQRWRNGHTLKRSPEFGRNLHVEYGFKPPLVPSVEIDDQGIPLNSGILKPEE